MHFKLFLYYLAASFLLLSLSSRNNSLALEKKEKIIIKLGAIAPEGSSYMEVVKKVSSEIKTKSSGKIKINWYPGATLGDEPDMLRLIKIGQLQGGFFTDYGMGKIEPSARAIELPFVFKDYDEVDRKMDKLCPILSKRAEEKGFYVLCFGETGFVYFFSKRPLKEISNFKGLRMWFWAEDDYTSDRLKLINGILLIPLSLIDVFAGLQTGIIEAFYTTPFAAVAFQWHTQINYMLDYPVAYVSAWIVLSKKFFDSLPEGIMKNIRESFAKYSEEIKRIVRKDNADAKKIMAEKGIKILKPDERFIRELKDVGRIAIEKVSKKYIPGDILKILK